MTEAPAVVAAPSGWGLAVQAAGCPHCGHVFLLPADHVPGQCPACFQATLAPQPARARTEPPELLVPHTLGTAQLSALLANWARGVWLRPPELAAEVLSSRLIKTYWPMWLVDIALEGSWQAQAGFDYQVASAQDDFRGGQWVSRQVTETRTRWEPRTGEVNRSYQNVMAPALDEHNRLAAGLGVEPREAARPYACEAVQDAAVFVPDLEPSAAWPFAKARIDEQAAADCQAAAGAQRLDQFKLAANYRGPNWTQLLLPAYATAYRDDEGHWLPILINGQTGRILGVRRASQRAAWRWTGAAGVVAAALFLLGLAISLSGALLPPLVLLGGALLIASLVAGVLAPIPAVWAWQFNRQAPVEPPRRPG